MEFYLIFIYFLFLFFFNLIFIYYYYIFIYILFLFILFNFLMLLCSQHVRKTVLTRSGSKNHVENVEEETEAAVAQAIAPDTRGLGPPQVGPVGIVWRRGRELLVEIFVCRHVSILWGFQNSLCLSAPREKKSP